MSHMFLEYPGVKERHLQRQYKNPLFPAEYNDFDEQRVQGARYMDEQDNEEFMHKFHAILDEVAQLKANEASETMLDLKSRLDELYEQCSGLTGQHENEQQAIIKLVQVIMASVKQSALGDAEAEHNLYEEELARNTHYHLLRFPIVSDLLSPHSPISKDQLVASLLSESEEAIKAVFQLFEAQHISKICAEAEILINNLTTESSVDVSEINNKLHLMRTLLVDDQ